MTDLLQTQLQILTAVVKLFLKKPQSSQGLVQKILQGATERSDNPDIRDRAYVYWRLLSGDLDVAKVGSPVTKMVPLLTSDRASSSRRSRPSPRP